ncbi:MAG: O-antigen ligase family protein [Planctomycetes bacterium]|nr:O-antigen ligase family protein [Planctomycetota bacterium]
MLGIMRKPNGMLTVVDAGSGSGAIAAFGLRCMEVGTMVMVGAACISLFALHVGLAIATIGALLARAPLQRLPGFWIAFAFAAWQVLSVAVAAAHGGQPFLRTGMGSTFTWFALYIAAFTLRDPSVRRRSATVLAIALLASVALATIQFFVGFGGSRPFRVSLTGRRFAECSGFMPLHLTQGFILTEILLIFMLDGAATGVSRCLTWSVRIAAPIGILLAFARSSFLGAAAALGAFAACSMRKIVYGIGLAALLLGISFTLALLRDPDQLENLARLDDGRVTIWEVSLRMIGQHPWFGVGGADNFKRENDRLIAELYPDHTRDRWLQAPHAHNSFLGLAAEHGLPSTLLYVALIAAVLVHLHRLRTEAPNGWRLGCSVATCAVVSGQFEHLAGHSGPSFVLFLTLGFALAITSISRQPALGAPA